MGTKVPAKPRGEARLSSKPKGCPPQPADLCICAHQHSTRKPDDLLLWKLELTVLGTPGTPACSVLCPQVMSCSVVKKKKKLPPQQIYPLTISVIIGESQGSFLSLLLKNKVEKDQIF